MPPRFDCSPISTNREIVWYSTTFRITTTLGIWQFKRGSFKRLEGRGRMPIVMSVLKNNTAVEPLYNKGPRRWQNSFAIITRFRYIEVRFHIFYYYWRKQNCLLNRGLRYIEVRYIEDPLYIQANAMTYSSKMRRKCSVKYETYSSLFISI